MINTLRRRWGLDSPQELIPIGGDGIVNKLVCLYLFNDYAQDPNLHFLACAPKIYDLGPNRLHTKALTNNVHTVIHPKLRVDFGRAKKLDPTNATYVINVDTPENISLFEIQSQTIACWIYVPSGLPGVLAAKVICTNKNSALTTGWEYGLNANVGHWQPFFSLIDGVLGESYVNGASTVTYDKWHFLVVVADVVNHLVDFYIDGVLNASSPYNPATGAINYSTVQKFLIGARADALYTSGMYLGYLMLWKRLLSKREIWHLYNEPFCFFSQPNPRSIFLLGQESVQSEFAAALDQLQDSRPVTKIEFIDTAGTITDISAYYDTGGSIEKIKDRAPNEIQAGNFDITLFNTDDKFSEYKASSLFYNLQYIGSKIRVSEGFVTSDGTATYEIQAIGFIDELLASEDNSRVTLRCRDRIRDILDKQIHTFPFSEVPVFDAGNVGNGIITSIETLPFKTVNEDWTLTCTLGGADGVATFSVVGSVSGNVGTATSGTQFSTGTGAGGIRFTINGGGTNWVIGDKITFSTKQYPEWSAKNPVKIIWSILTGYNWDTGVVENFSSLVLSLDHTNGADNTDINYDSFVQAVADIVVAGTVVKGYAAYNESAYTVIADLLLLILGSIFTGPDGKIMIRTSVPKFSPSYRNFSDVKKVTRLGYNRSVDEVINRVTVNYKRRDAWEFSGDTPNLDSTYSSSDSASIAKYGNLGQSFDVRWYSATTSHITDFATKLLDKFSEPPLNIDFDTGLDALRTDIGDRISVTDTKYGFGVVQGEVAKITKLFDAKPTKKISLRLRRDGNTGLNWGFLGSNANENDGLSPQSAGWDTATDADKVFAYLSQTGGGGPDYRLF